MAKTKSVFSDVLTPTLCGPCSIVSNVSDATKFCVECNETLCDTCVRLHRRFPTMKGHTIIMQTEIELLSFTRKLLTDQCDKHEGKHLDTLCTRHDELCCSVCVSLHHRTCEGFADLSQFVKEKSTKDITKIRIQAIEQMKEKFQRVSKARLGDKRRMEKEMANSNKKVDNYRKQLVSEIHRIYTESKGQVTASYENAEKSLAEFVSTCDMKIDELTKVLKCLNDEHLDDIRYFGGVKRAEKIVTENKENLNVISTVSEIQDLAYKLDFSLKHELHAVRCFGTFKIHTYGHHLDKLQKKSTETFKVHIGRQLSQYTFSEGKDSCNFQGLSLYENNQIIAVDWNNKKLKLINRDMKVMQTFSLLDHPRDICVVEQNICVSYKDRHRVEISELKGIALLTKKIIAIGKTCRGVCYKNGELFVACGMWDTAEIRVYSLNGRLKRSFSRESLGNELFTAPFYVNTNNSGSLLFVGDSNSGVFAMRMDGTVAWRYTSQKKLRNVWDIAVDENDDLYVCGFGSNNVMKIFPCEKRVEVVITDIYKPTVILYDKINRKLIVSSSNRFTDADTMIIHEMIKLKD